INIASLTVNTVRLSDDFFGADNDMRSLYRVELDISNISTTYPVPTTPNTRINKDHSLDNVIGDMQSGLQTRRMTVTTDKQEFISAIYEEKTHEDLHTCLGKIDQTLFIKGQKEDILLVQVYVDDIIFGSTKKELCTEFEELMHYKFQMSSMEELTFFLGLEVKQKSNGIFISQDKYVDEILRKFKYEVVKSSSTPMDKQKALFKDSDGDDVDVQLYRFMIGSLVYLTSSRLDIMFVVCTCAKFQVTLKVSHLHAVKRIIRYLKGQPKLSLWYPRDSQFDLVAYTDSDYAGASLDRKSTSGGCEFLGSRLISWQCKKQAVVVNSTTEAEYV
nr:uncharacterized mitochondrial protein AtMg00810-like [Tanacetum cinerariifolium]